MKTLKQCINAGMIKMSNINVKTADLQVKKLRNIINNSPTKTTEIKLDTLVELLLCMERLSILERHILNLVSDAYDLPKEEKSN